jgi:hypothetical protein
VRNDWTNESSYQHEIPKEKVIHAYSGTRLTDVWLIDRCAPQPNGPYGSRNGATDRSQGDATDGAAATSLQRIANLSATASRHTVMLNEFLSAIPHESQRDALWQLLSQH